ncbi:MAG: hypothetical protein Q9226_000461 [Calogaya cf. arnoldii]
MESTLHMRQTPGARLIGTMDLSATLLTTCLLVRLGFDKLHRRLARRGGVKRISGGIYDEIRKAMTDRLKLILKDCTIFLEHSQRKTVTVKDVVFALKRVRNLYHPPKPHANTGLSPQQLGRPIYGFDQ